MLRNGGGHWPGVDGSETARRWALARRLAIAAALLVLAFAPRAAAAQQSDGSPLVQEQPPQAAQQSGLPGEGLVGAPAANGIEAAPAGANLFSAQDGRAGNADPRIQQDWLRRPLSASVFVGGMVGSPLVDNWLEQRDGYQVGIRFGWDYDEYFAFEARYAFGSCALFDTDRARAALAYFDAQNGILPSNPLSGLNAPGRNSDWDIWNVEFLYFPWGEGRWRPYIMTGIGMGQLRFNDILGDRYSASVADVPVAVGVKYHLSDRLALRIECCDDLILSGGSGFNSVNDVSLSASLELRFGGHGKTYWPWDPSANAW